MNTSIKTLTTTVFIAIMVLTVSCKNKAETNDKIHTEQTKTTQKKGKEYTSAFVCPMHCEGSGSDKEGTCPKCGMTYLPNEKYKNGE